jgi:hypothetical protein
MKAGSRGIAPLLNHFAINSPSNSLGLGWLFSYLILSGSPVAAGALTFLDGGVIGEIETLFMITGSRLGAAFIVLFIGFIYILWGHGKLISLSMGLLSLSVTAVVYLSSLAISYLLLTYQVLDFIQFGPGNLLRGAIDLIFTPISKPLTDLFPSGLVFFIGLGVIITSFVLFDRVIPKIKLRRTDFSQTPRLIYRPVVMFILGAMVTLVSMSVSVSLSILVPLSTRGYVRRENVIPYIMGANITTFIDTMLVAVFLNNPQALVVVLSVIVSVATVSLIIITLFYRHFERTILTFVSYIGKSNLNLTVFVVVILVLPVILILWK